MDKIIAQQALEMVLKAGAEQARVVLTESTINSYSLLDGELERLQHSLSSSLYFQLYVDGKYGTFSTNRMEKGDFEKYLREAVASTKLLAPDTCRGLPDPKYYFRGEALDLKQCDPAYHDINPDAKRELLEKLGGEIDRSDKRIISVANEYEDFKENVYTIDSQGFSGETSQTLFSLSTECSVKGRGDVRPQNFWYDNTMFFDTLPLGCGKTALERTLGMLGAKKVKSGKYHVILDRSVSSRVISPIFSALSGGAIQQKNSFLLDTIGKDIFGEKLTIIDSPHLPGLMGSRWFDSEGLATCGRGIIEKGVPKTYFLTTYFANKLGMEPTVESVSVPELEPFGEESAKDMMKGIGRGILITGFNGGNCNGATGDFSFGIEGYLFENGVISHPIKEMNMTGNIVSLWNNISNIGKDYRECSRWRIPSLSFTDVDLSGI